MLPLSLDVIQVVGFEIPVARLMTPNQNGHDFTQPQAPFTLSDLSVVFKTLSLPLRFKDLTEIIDGTEEFF